MHGGNAAIVGAAETDRLGIIPDMSMMELHADAALRAVADAGLTLADIDGIATAGPRPLDVAHHLGITPRWMDGTDVGGCSFLLHVRHGAAAVAAGAANAILIVHGESGRSGIGHNPVPRNESSAAGQFEWPYGALAPTAAFTLPALRFLHDRGMGRRDLANVVVAQRRWAQDNPRAARRKPVTAEDVLAGPTTAFPFTKEMCCVVTDGGGAVVVTTRERAADSSQAGRAVYLLGSGEACEGSLVGQMDDLGSSGAFVRASREAFRTAQLSPSDIDHLMVYDAFAHLPLYGLEDLGFVGRGESGAFIADGHTSPGGTLPMNTQGGGLAYTHTGKYGIFAILEAVRQLRGEAVMQAPGVETSFVQGVGGWFWSAGSLVLANRLP